MTFRSLSVRDVLDLAVKGGLDVVEWGADVHVLPGDLESAARVGASTRDAGLDPVVYGSYWWAGDGKPIDPIAETAATLGAPRTRVWAGREGSANASEASVQAVIDDLAMAAEAAISIGTQLVLELHSGTLADTPAAAMKLVRALPAGRVLTHWQPTGLPEPAELAGLRLVSSALSHIHVFEWRGEDRHHLAYGRRKWRDRFAALGHTEALPVMLEFVRDDEPAQFLDDCRTLQEILGEVAQP